MPSVKLVKTEASIAAVRLPALAEIPVTEGKKIEPAKDVMAVSPQHRERLLPLKHLQAGRRNPLLKQAVPSIAVVAAKVILQDLLRERVVLLPAKAATPSQRRFLVRSHPPTRVGLPEKVAIPSLLLLPVLSHPRQ